MALRPGQLTGLVLLAVIGLFSFPSGAADFVDSQTSPYLVRSWQTEQGLPHNLILAVIKSRDGYLWLGTGHGLARFDGVRCQEFGLKDGLRALEVFKLIEDRQGSLWIGTVGGGLSRYANGQIVNYTGRDGLKGDDVTALMEDSDGGLWVGTTTGLFRRLGEHFEAVGEEWGRTYIRALARDRAGNVWVATLHAGLMCYQNGKYFEVPGPPEAKSISAYSLLVDSQDRLWLGLQNGVLLCRDQGRWIKYGPDDGLPQVFISSLAQTADGLIWAGSLDEGLYCLRDGRFHALRIKDGLSDDAIVSLFADQQQNLWVGTRSGGLDQVSPKKLSVCLAMDGTAERLPLSLAQTTNGDLWVGASGHGVYHWDGTGFRQFLNDPPMSWHLFIGALLATDDGSLWWGAGPAVFQSRNGQIASYDREAWLQGDRVLSLCANQGGGMWIGTYNGQLELLQQNQFAAITNLSGKPVTALVQETNGTLWIGSMGGGLARLQQGKITTFEMKDGLPSDLVRTLFLDDEGTLWIGTVSGGLARWSHGRFANFTPKEGLIDDTVLQILDDGLGYLWLGCNRGICRVSKKALDDLAAGRPGFIYPLVFGQPEGMISEQCEGNFGAALRTCSGQLCFCTARGIVIIDPRQRPGSTTPVVMLESVAMDENADVPILAGGGSAIIKDIPPGPHRFEFRYTGLNWVAPEKIRFRYRLENLDSDWLEAGSGRTAIYSYVPPGNYRFHVIACNSDGLWNETGAAVSFIVPPHFWQTSWFLGAVILSVLGATGAGVRFVVHRRLHARLERLERERAMERERARIARDLHDELGSSLTRISMLSDLAQSRDNSAEQLKSRVTRISDFAVRTARSLDEIVWAVNPRNDSLRSLLEYLTQFASELFEDTGIRCRFQIPENLPRTPLLPDVRHNVFLAVKEALANVLKHGQATEVCLEARMIRQQIEISVRDDGAGFDPETLAATTVRSGLKNMRHRIESLGGRFSVEAAVGKGTRVSILLDCSPQPPHASHEPG